MHSTSIFEVLESRVLLSCDVPDIGDFPNAEELSLTLTSDWGSDWGSVDIDGTLDEPGDTDVFRFTSPAEGEVGVAGVGSYETEVRVRFLDANGEELDNDNEFSRTHNESERGIASHVIMADLGPNEVFYVVVSGDNVGQYELLVGAVAEVASGLLFSVMEDDRNAQPPNPGDVPGFLEDATELTLEPTNDWGSAEFEGRLIFRNEPDVYRFVSSPAGSIGVAAVGSRDADLTIRFLAANGCELEHEHFSRTRAESEFGVSSNVVMADLTPGETFYLVISGGYGAHYDAVVTTLDGPAAGTLFGLQQDDRWFADPDLIPPGPIDISADGQYGDSGTAGSVGGDDTQVYLFEADRAGAYRMMLATDSGMPDVAIFDPDGATVATYVADAGYLAATIFATEAGQIFSVNVTSPDGDFIDFTLRFETEYGYVDGETERSEDSPLPYVTYYPEGFSGSTIEEFVPIVNPNDFDVTYELIAHYETGERDEVIASGTIDAHSRAGVTISSARFPNASLVRAGVPYALELRSDGALGATLSHYDFGVTTGENFSSVIDTSWTFARAVRAPDRRDFLVFYNPNDVDTSYTITLYYEDGTTLSINRTVEAKRRAGISFATDTAITADGVFGIELEADLPLIAALSAYDVDDSHGFGTLGAIDGGSTQGFLPKIDATADETTIAALNTSDEAITLELTITDAEDQSTTPIVRTFTLDANSQTTISTEDLELDPEIDYTIEYSASDTITIGAQTVRDGDADATTVSNRSATTLLFADAFRNTNHPDVYAETLEIVNTGDSLAGVNVIYLFTDGGTITRTYDSTPGEVLEIDVNIDRRLGPQPYSIIVASNEPLIATFRHYDFFLDGGWSTAGTPV